MSFDIQNSPVKLVGQLLISLFYKWRRVRLREAKVLPTVTEVDFDHSTPSVSQCFLEMNIVQF